MTRAAGPPTDHADDGFTLIELLIVIVILGVLAAVVVFAVGGITDRGDDAAVAADAKTVIHAMEAYRAINETYPTEAGLVSAGLLHDQSDIHDISLGVGGSSYTLVPAGSGGGGGGGGGNGGISAQTIGSFAATVYNQGGSPIVAVFSHRNLSASLTSISGSFPGEIIWFNDPALDSAAEITSVLGTVADDGVFADATDSGWDAGSAADAMGNPVGADGWSYAGDVGGLLEFGPTGVTASPSNYLLKTVQTFGDGNALNAQVAFFPADSNDVLAFEDLVDAGQSIPGVTLHLMPLPTLDPAPFPSTVVATSEIPDLVDNSDFSLLNPSLVAGLAPSTAGFDWQAGDLASWVAAQVHVGPGGLYVTGVLI